MSYPEHPITAQFHDSSKRIRRFAGVMVADGVGSGKTPRILLGMKKRGFGTGKWQHSFAGKVEVGEDVREAAKRELREESGLVAEEDDLRLLGVFYYEFLNPSIASFIMEVTIFTAQKFEGKAEESPEIKPSVFKSSEIPYRNMWADNEYWLPTLLKSKSWPPEYVLEAFFLYESLTKICTHSIKKSFRNED